MFARSNRMTVSARPRVARDEHRERSFFCLRNTR